MPKTEKCRIFVLGDSTIFHGDGSMETAIPARMQDRLHDRGLIGARVYNYGIPGCTFHQPMALMHSLLLDYEPDLIVINIGGVDSVIHKNHDPRPGYPMWGFMFQLAQEHCQRTSADADYSTRDNWERLASDWLDLGRIAGNDMEDAYIGRVADEFKIALNRIGRFADAYGLPTLLTLQPIAHTRVNPPASESGMANPNAMDIIRRQYHAFKKVAFPDGQREVQWSRNLKVVDITDVFDPCDGRIYTDHVHYNSTGRDMMTRRFIELLEPYLASFRCEVASSLEEINIGASVQTLRRAVH